MPFDINELPNLTGRRLRYEQMVFTLNTESEDLVIQAVMEDEYDGGKTITLSRPKVTFRNQIGGEDRAYTTALNRLLPDDDNVTWTNPRKTLQMKLMELLKEAITK
jgi:hypothetical protein